MKVIIWVDVEQLEDLSKGKSVDYFEREPGVFENVVQVMVTTDTYQRLKDEKNNEKYTGE
jgi:hypothetical protein